jgi:hypothetical protein
MAGGLKLMKLLNLLFVIVACTVVILLSMESDATHSSSATDPNPMKVNQEQFVRIQPTYLAESNK